ncbi:MAG: NUDIX hydrolase [Chitinophagaceae bacterium]|nr:NUDIX hydrolase [Chitinophagaceae bacterium]
MNKYQNQTHLLAAVDCIIFGFDGSQLKILLIHRALEPELGKWSLMGGFIQSNESSEQAAVRVLKVLTGMDGVYLEQLYTFSQPNRDPIERTLSTAYFALVDIALYEKQISDEYHAEWFPLTEMPSLIFDHESMVTMAREKLKYKAALHPLLFELLPKKFTLPQLQSLYQSVFNKVLDKRNFSRKVLSTNLLIKQPDKDKGTSKKGAFYYTLNTKNYKEDFQAFLNIIPNSHLL